MTSRRKLDREIERAEKRARKLTKKQHAEPDKKQPHTGDDSRPRKLGVQS